MGELQHEAFQFTFNGFLKVAFQGSRVTSDAGLILVRALDERLGLGTLISEHLNDSRQGLNTQFSLGSPAAVGLQPARGLRRPQRRGPGVGGPNLSPHRVAKALGPRCGADIDVALVRDRAADPSEESRVYPGFPTLFWGLSWFFVDDLMGKALWKLAENAQRFPRCGGRVLCVHGAGSFHRAHPYATRSPRPRTAVDP